MNRFLLSLTLLLFATSGFTQKTDSLLIRRLADEMLVNGKAYATLKVLTKTIGGRLSGSPAMYKAEAWGQEALKDAGAEKIWTQECLIPHWIRGGHDSASLTWLENKRSLRMEALDILALGNSVGTGPAGITAPVVVIHSFDELQKMGVGGSGAAGMNGSNGMSGVGTAGAGGSPLKGKIVFYDVRFDPRQIETFKAYEDAVRYRVMGPSLAAKYGAIGVLVRSMSESTDNNPHTGSLNYNDSFPKIPAAAVGLRDADKLEAVLQNNGQASVHLRTMGRMLADTVAHNIIGEIRGTEYPDQVITIGGHLDSWDPAEGAHDDGAGVVHAIEVLRALKAIGYKPRHTIRVVLFANEENGLRGATKYAEWVKAQHEKELLALESDEGGFTPRCFSFSLKPAQLARLHHWIRLLQPYGVYEFTGNGGGADVHPLSEQGIVVGELVPDSQRYFDYHHSRGDVLEAVNPRELELGALNMAALVYLVDKYGLF